MPGEMDKRKAKMKAKVLQGNREIPLSAQEYALLTKEEKQALREVFIEDGRDPDEYERHMKKLWPKEVVFHTKWRHRG